MRPPPPLPFILAVLLLLPAAAADDDPFDCRPAHRSLSWDLHKLSSHTITHNRAIPPTDEIDEVELNLCHSLKAKDGVPEEDQCPLGTRICLRTTNKKASHSDRIVRVIPIAAELASPPSTLAPDISYGSSDNSRPLNLILHGPAYPPSSHHHAISQSANITIVCAEEASDPKFVSYTDSTGVLLLEWEHPAGCVIRDGRDAPEEGGGGGEEGDGGGRRGGSGVGWFFLVLLIAIIAYFALGAYYNYTQYGASGWDLLPHRDFWRDVPFLLRDVGSHLFAAVRPGGRGGYTSV